MKNVIKLAFVAALATALATMPASSYAQSRRSGGSSSHSSSYSGGSHHSSSSHSSGSVSRSSGSSHRSSGAVSHSSGSSHRSSGSVSRSSGSYGSATRSGSSASRGSYGSASRPSGSYGGQTRSSGSSSRQGSYNGGYSTSHPSGSTASRSSAGNRSVTPSRPSSGAPATRSGAQVAGRRSADGHVGAAPQTRGSAAAPGQSRRSAATPGRPVTGSLGNRPAPAGRRSAASVGGPNGHGPAGGHGMSPARDHRLNGGPRVHPRNRGFIEHDRIGCFYGHHHPHYYGWRVHSLPLHYRHHRYWGWDYYYYGGIYYRWYDGFYCVCRPPFGVYFDRMLYDLDLVLIDFAYYNTVNRTYSAINENYRTIEEQNRIIAENNAAIASQNAALSGRTRLADESYNLAASLGLVQSYADANVKYYYDDGVFFIEGKDGQYQTIIPPAGAIISELPDDYETVVIGGQEYYRVDNTIYRMVAIDGKAYFEVLGQQVN